MPDAAADVPNGHVPDAPASEEQTNLWSSILDSVSSSKARVPTRNVLVIGEPRSGKSTLVSHITGIPPPAEAAGGKDASRELDFALGSDYCDVNDEGDDDTLARLSLYELPSSDPAYLNLLSLPLNPSALPNTLVLVVLDWERPWHFVRDLARWVAVLEERVADLRREGEAESGKEGGWSRVGVALDEMREKLEATIQTYTEPPLPAPSSTTNASQPAPIAPAPVFAAPGDLLPLGSGVLTHNKSGIPLVVVCHKSDAIERAEAQGKHGWAKEEAVDWVQQVLRGICLKYGAALFYTSQTRPESFSRLRAYILHRLFTSPTTLSSSAAAAPSGAPPPTGPRRFPFPFRANVIDRDAVLVPTGWDSWGKIRVLREGFDADADVVSSGWDADVERERRRVSGAALGEDEGGTPGESARQAWEVVVPDPATAVSHSAASHAAAQRAQPVVAEDESDFLSKLHAQMQQDPGRDPRNSFRPQPGQPSAAAAAPSAGGSGASFTSGVVGPMGSGSLSLPSVERALKVDPGGMGAVGVGEEDMASKFARMRKGEAARPGAPLARAASTGPISPTTPGGTAGSPGSGGVPQSQHEVLQNFFQSLLSQKTGSPASTPPPAATVASPKSPSPVPPAPTAPRSPSPVKEA